MDHKRTLKSKLETLVECLEEYETDFRSLLSQVNDIQHRARLGVYQEKVCNRREEGVVELTERYPSIELDCVKVKQSLVNNILDLIAKSEEDEEIDMVINFTRLEDII